MPRDPAAREARQLTTGAEPRPWLRRFLTSLNGRAEEHDRLVRLIIIERIVKSAVLIVLAVCLIVFGRNGQLTVWAQAVEDGLNLESGRGILSRLALVIVDRIGNFNHTTTLALGLILYAALEGTEGVGLHLRRRWAEYLTVFATGLLIPFELYEVLRQATMFKVAALILNVAVVAYLAWRKRLFLDV